MKSVPVLLLLCIVCSCSHEQLVQPADYDRYLTPAHLDQRVSEAQKEINFWQKRLARDTGNFLDLLQLGYNHLGLFKLKGDLVRLKTADSLIESASAKLNQQHPEILQAIAQVAITQHQFRKAVQYNNAALHMNGSRYTHALLAFDGDMEIGQFTEASQHLSRFSDKESFDYLIRKAKYQDHLGNLEGAIELMKAACRKIEPAKNKSLDCWVLSNLADMYGHAGEPDKAYQTYLEVLRKEPAYIYALKGIAWLAYAHDKNTTEAKRILQFITRHTNTPELYLTLAEIAAFENNPSEHKKYTLQFCSIVDDPAYGAMYNKYLIDIYAQDPAMISKALTLAQQEVAARPTPETYTWLAWVYYQQGQFQKAYDTYVMYVKGRSFEPEALFKGGFILLAANKKAEARKLFLSCMESSLELGPVSISHVEAELKKMNR
jgi:tetratricopeptide (TPR) repeat protein